MRNHRLMSPVAMIAILLAAAAPPPDRPPAAPVRDAILAYHITSSADAFDIGVVVRSAGGAIRVDLPDHSYMLATPADHTLVMVVPTEGTAMDLPWSDGPQALFLLDNRMTFVRKGEATVAGLRCSVWDATLGGPHSTLCITADGLMLRSAGQDPQGRRTLIEAVAVRYQSLPVEEFSIPPGFDHLTATQAAPAK